MPTPSCCDRLTLRVVLLKVSPARRPAGRPFSGRASRRSAARSRLERTSVLQLPYPRPRDWPTTPLANSPPARVPASAPRKVPIGVSATFDLQQDVIFGQPTRLQYQIAGDSRGSQRCEAELRTAASTKAKPLTPSSTVGNARST